MKFRQSLSLKLGAEAMKEATRATVTHTTGLELPFLLLPVSCVMIAM